MTEKCASKLPGRLFWKETVTWLERPSNLQITPKKSFQGRARLQEPCIAGPGLYEALPTSGFNPTWKAFLLSTSHNFLCPAISSPCSLFLAVQENWELILGASFSCGLGFLLVKVILVDFIFVGIKFHETRSGVVS